MGKIKGFVKGFFDGAAECREYFAVDLHQMRLPVEEIYHDVAARQLGNFHHIRPELLGALTYGCLKILVNLGKLGFSDRISLSYCQFTHLKSPELNCLNKITLLN